MPRLYALLTICLHLLCLPAYAQFEDIAKMRSDEPPPPPPAATIKSSSEPAPTQAEEPKVETPPKSTTGLFLGQIAAIDPKERYLFIKPSKQHEGPRRTFYIDKMTIYRRANKKSGIDEFRNGENVGIRYIKHNDLYLAVGVFYIEGDEVDLNQVKMPPTYRR